MSGRWPPEGGPRHRADGRPDPYEAQFAELTKAIGDLRQAVGALVPPVLSAETYQLDANGQCTKQYRVPFRSIAVYSASANQLILAQQPPGPGAPGQGPGSEIIPPRGFKVCNMAGNAWTIYGGNQGDLVTVETFARPQPPACDPGPLTGAQLGTVTTTGQPLAPQGSVVAYGSVTSAAAGQQIVSSGNLAAGTYQVTIINNVGGSSASGDANNVQLQVGATVIGTLIQSSSSGAVTQPQTANVVVPANTAITVNAIAAAVVGATYRTQIIVTRIG